MKQVKFSEFEFEGKQVPLPILDGIMDEIGFTRAGQWDYERVTYDFKFEDMTAGNVYYLRLQGFATEGDVDKGNAIIQLLPAAYLGRHYYPHGVEYDNEDFPAGIVSHCKDKLHQVLDAVTASIQ
nr:YugN family protein [Aureibacillus halotolerans]